MLSVLRLDAIRLEELVLRSRPEASAPGADESYTFLLQHRDLTVDPERVDRVLQLVLRLRPQKVAEGMPAPAVECIEVRITGFFTFADRASEDLRKTLYPMAAVSMLLGVARGMIAQATGLFPTGTFILPPLDVTQTAKRKRLTGVCTLKASRVRPDQMTATVSDQPAH